ncbi:MAG: MinD/ParA family protein [Acetobacter sp.]|nr:MinD/ParA family protein [Acetobacter sp.]
MNTKNITEQAALAMAERKLPRPQVRNMIAVASGKGGVGKTWFSITLAHAFSKAGLKTLLFDGDLGLANIDIQLGLMPVHDLGSVIAGKATLNQAVTHYDAGNFDIIAGRSGSGSLANIPLSRLQLINDDLRVLAGGYDRVIVDLGAGVEKTVRLFAGSAATLLIVCTDEPTALTDAYAFIKMMCMEQQKPNIRIVVNSANSSREGERTYTTLLKACQGFLRISPPLAGVIRRDTRVRDSIRNQTSILNRHPNTEAAEDVLSIALRLNKEQG